MDFYDDTTQEHAPLGFAATTSWTATLEVPQPSEAPTPVGPEPADVPAAPEPAPPAAPPGDPSPSPVPVPDDPGQPIAPPEPDQAPGPI